MLNPRNVNRQGGFPLLEVLGLTMILIATVLFVTQLSAFSQERQRMPQGLRLGGVPVSGLTREGAKAMVEQTYGAPITVMYRDQEIRLSPSQVGFRVNSDAMLSRADELRTEGTFWSGFWDYLWRRPERASEVELDAEYSPELLKAWLADIAARYDRPPQAAVAELDTMSFQTGMAGYVLDQEQSFQLIDSALKRPVNRTVNLVVGGQDAPRPDMETLQELFIEYLVSQEFSGAVSIYAIDLEHGDHLHFELDLRQPDNPIMLNCEIAYSALSTMKIPIMVDYFRYLDWEPFPYEYDMVQATMTLSSNLNANFMLRDIGGGDAKEGTRIVSDSMHYLGLTNTFIVAPYDDEDPPRYSYDTPAWQAAREGACINTLPDYAMQTTVTDLALLLDMIYQCAAFNGGGLMAAYPGEFTQRECQTMLDVMSQNEEGRLILSGVPESVPVAHKHGYTTDTMGDAGIVFSPGGDYALVIFIWADVEWLSANVAFPIMEGISVATFNYFNPDLVNEPRRGMPDFVNSSNP